MIARDHGTWTSAALHELSRERARSSQLQTRLDVAVDALRILKPFLRHHDSCGRNRDHECDCGLKVALEAVAGVVNESAKSGTIVFPSISEGEKHEEA